MKTRFSVSEIFHIFAAQKQGMGETQKSQGVGGISGSGAAPFGNVRGVPFVSFSGNVLSSYRAPIARIVPDVTGNDGRGVALVTSRQYSITTSGHVSAARSALSHLAVFVVPDVLAKYDYEHEKNIAHLVAEYQAELARDLRARNLPYWLSDGEARNRYAHLAETIKAYAGLFGVNLFETQAQWAQGDFREHTRALIAAHRARDTPEAIARREKAKAKRAAQNAEKNRQEAERRAHFEKEREEREALEDATRAERIEAWRKGGAALYPRDLQKLQGALLRVKGDTLETSHGARVPLEDAKRVFAFITRGLAIAPNMSGEKSYRAKLAIGQYSLDEIFANGDFRAGCHSIKYEEAARLAAEIGFTPFSLRSSENIGATMARHDLSDSEWEALPEETQDKLISDTIGTEQTPEGWREIEA
jgi:hypothetical protein